MSKGSAFHPQNAKLTDRSLDTHSPFTCAKFYLLTHKPIRQNGQVTLYAGSLDSVSSLHTNGPTTYLVNGRSFLAERHGTMKSRCKGRYFACCVLPSYERTQTNKSLHCACGEETCEMRNLAKSFHVAGHGDTSGHFVCLVVVVVVVCLMQVTKRCRVFFPCIYWKMLSFSLRKNIRCGPQFIHHTVSQSVEIVTLCLHILSILRLPRKRQTYARCYYSPSPLSIVSLLSLSFFLSLPLSVSPFNFHV